MAYKIKEVGENYSINKPGISIPVANDNPDYIQFLDDIAYERDVVEGPDVVTASYVELRIAAYPSMAEQLDMQYWDAQNGTTTWADAIQAVKTANPKSVAGSTTAGNVPSWVQDAVDAHKMSKELRLYTVAIERLARYRLAIGREAVSEDIVIGKQVATDESGDNILDDEGQLSYVDVTEPHVIIEAIDPLSSTIERSSVDSDTGEPTTQQVANPEIVTDDAERAYSQSIVDAASQEVINAYNGE